MRGGQSRGTCNEGARWSTIAKTSTIQPASWTILQLEGVWEATHAPTSSPDTPYSAHRIYPQPHVDIYWIRAQRREAERSGQLLRQVLSKVIRRWYSAARFDVRRSMHEW